MENHDSNTQASPSPAGFQVNPKLDGEVAEAFNQYMEDTGVNARSAVAHSLIVQGLRKLGYLPPVNAKSAVSLQSAA